jgi:hypothetical protein
MGGMMATSPHTIVLSFYPPSRCFTARRLTGTNGIIEEPLVLLEIVMPMSEKYYVWKRSGIGIEIERATLTGGLLEIYRLLEKDMRGEIDRKLFNWRV